jgi:uncharacterized protein YjiS (DUF1127 family)
MEKSEMSKRTSKPIRASVETTVSDREHYADMPAGSRETMSRQIMSGAMESYALYGSALYSPLIRGASSEEVFSRHSSDRIYGPGYTANEAGANDNHRTLRIPTYNRAGRTPAADSRVAVSKAADGPVVVIKRLAGSLRSLWQYIRREQEIARAISLLADLDDRTLRDMGIHRSQIAQVARYGLDDSGRVRSPGS